MGTSDPERLRTEDVDEAFMRWHEARVVGLGADATDRDVLDYLVALVLADGTETTVPGG